MAIFYRTKRCRSGNITKLNSTYIFTLENIRFHTYDLFRLNPLSEVAIMKIGVIGVGYVGLTVGTCLAESGNDVICMDIDEDKINQLNAGVIPFYEPGLKELLDANVASGRLKFTVSLEEVVQNCFIIFITINTHPNGTGGLDVSSVENVCKQIISQIPDYRIIVLKSTVPVGTTKRLEEELSKISSIQFDIVNNPEFLKEGYAVEDFLRPDRIIIGTENSEVASILEELYAPFVRNGKPIIVMDSISSEMTKLAANAMLSTKISFINEIANICERVGADIDNVRRGICSDSRIGYQFLYPGLGFGGSCFPKDLKALLTLSEKVEYPAWLIKAVINVNEYQRTVIQHKITQHFGEDLSDKIFAIWGLSFKPRTDDIRDAPAIQLITDLLTRNAKVKAHDPRALDNTKKVFGNSIEYYEDMYEAIRDTDALCIATEWNEFRNPDYSKMLSLMKQPIIFDGRNLYIPEKMEKYGFTYYSIGRKQIIPSSSARSSTQ